MAPLAPSASQNQRGRGASRPSLSSAAEKQTAAAISGPLGERTEETYRIIGVTAIASPSREMAGERGLQSSQTAATSSAKAIPRVAARPSRIAASGVSAARIARPAGTYR
jgi:hypothetical protein